MTLLVFDFIKHIVGCCVVDNLSRDDRDEIIIYAASVTRCSSIFGCTMLSQCHSATPNGSMCVFVLAPEAVLAILQGATHLRHLAVKYAVR
jgi:hypothetical protein